jgi:stage II sporulation protein P
MKRRINPIFKYLIGIILFSVLLTVFSFLFCNFAKPIAPFFTDITKLSLSMRYINHPEKTEKVTDDKPKSAEKKKALSDEEIREVINKIPKEKRKSVMTKTIGKSGANLSYNNVYVRNITNEHTIDIKKLLAKKADVNITSGDDVQVLIMHTHTTESYMPFDVGYYNTDWNTRSDNPDENTVAVGRIIKDKLTKAGIKTVQSEKIHDKEYTGAYEKSEKTVKAYLKKYPKIQVVLDIHRDAITYDDGTKLKPTIEINGKNAAQIMIINGCEEGDITDYPDWEVNMIFALKLQKELEDKYPGLARPLYFAIKKYNQHLTHGSILIEMGSEANTLDEAKYSAELLSDCLISLLKSQDK